MAIDPNNLSGTAIPTFSEDFNTFKLWDGTSGLDTRPGWAMWPNYNAGFSETGNGEQEWFIQPNYQPTASANPFSVQNGVLTISAAPTDPAISQYVDNYPYTSGWIDTYHEFSQTYGYFEMKAELPAGQGLWPAFWLLPKDNSWPPELDVMEMIGSQPNELVTTVHSQVSGANELSSTHFDTSAGTNEPGMTTGFHTYGVDWEPNTITWYFDGQKVFQTATPADMNQPMYMIADLAVGGYWPGAPDSSTPFPAQMKIDYLRAYQAAPAPTTGGTTADPPPSSNANGTATATNGGTSDVLWSNSDGTLADWSMNGSQVASGQTVTFQGNAATPDASWSVAGIGDFNGDGHSDILWRNTNGTLVDWTMNGSQITSSPEVTFQGNAVDPNASWGVAGIGDFNGDGKSDLLWRDINGTLVDWSMNGAQVTASQQVTQGSSAATPDASWSVAGIGDFNGDGKSDILWRNTNGTLIDWTMNGSQIASNQEVTLQGAAATPDSSWSVAGIGDFNGDGKSDILWRDTNGTLVDWIMNGSQVTSSQAVTIEGSPAMPSTSWQIAQIGDFNGDGKSDILWRNNNGTLAEWTMNGSQITSAQEVTFQGNPIAPASSWSTLSKPTDFI